MCIIKAKKFPQKETLADLTEEFPVWKVIRKTGHAEYDNDCVQPKLLARRTHVAEIHSAHRVPLSYKPSFHAFLNQKDAEAYIESEKGGTPYLFVVKKYWMKKADVTMVGMSMHHDKRTCCIAASKIRRK